MLPLETNLRHEVRATEFFVCVWTHFGLLCLCLHLHRRTVLDFACPLRAVGSSVLWEVKTELQPNKRIVQDVGTAFSAGFLISQRSQAYWPGLCASGVSLSTGSAGMSWASLVICNASAVVWLHAVLPCTDASGFPGVLAAVETKSLAVW